MCSIARGSLIGFSGSSMEALKLVYLQVRFGEGGGGKHLGLSRRQSQQHSIYFGYENRGRGFSVSSDLHVGSVTRLHKRLPLGAV